MSKHTNIFLLVFFFQDGVIKEKYITSKAQFGIVIQLPDNNRCIATLFRNRKVFSDFEAKLTELQNQRFEPGTVHPMAKHMAHSMGFASILVNVHVDGQSNVSLDEFVKNEKDPIVLEQMARILCAMTLDEDDE